MTKHPATITATYRIVTPMFCAGANQQTAELRLPSFKGALRFWWRSLMWKKVEDHHELRDKEAALFGASDGRFGQSKVHLHLKTKDLEADIARGDRIGRGDQPGISYLGYGVMNFRGELQRPPISGGVFSVVFRFSKLATDKQINEVCNAVRLLGTVGGIGSKSRKGFGSLTLTSLQRDGNPQVVPVSAVDRLRELLLNLPEGLPEWSAWSNSSRVLTFRLGRNPATLLDHCGRLLANFRGWHGREQSQFVDDHDLLFNYLSDGTELDRPPERVAFGLPHNYFFKSLSDRQSQLNVKAEVTPEKHRDDTGFTRRASPLFVHINDTGKGDPEAVIAFLPSRFLPAPANISIVDTSTRGKSNRTRKRPLSITVSPRGLWNPIVRFLDELSSMSDLNAQEVTFD